MLALVGCDRVRLLSDALMQSRCSSSTDGSALAGVGIIQ